MDIVEKITKYSPALLPKLSEPKSFATALEAYQDALKECEKRKSRYDEAASQYALNSTENNAYNLGVAINEYKNFYNQVEAFKHTAVYEAQRIDEEAEWRISVLKDRQMMCEAMGLSLTEYKRFYDEAEQEINAYKFLRETSKGFIDQMLANEPEKVIL